MMTIHRMMLKTHPLLTTHVRSVHSGHSREKFPKGVAPAGLRGRLGRRSLRQGAAVLSCRRERTQRTQVLGTLVGSNRPPHVLRPPTSFSPPNPCGAALLRRTVSRCRQ
jgi:hypothetical protein